MAVSIASATTLDGVGTGERTIAKPTGTSEGDLLFMTIQNATVPKTWTWPVGFTEHASSPAADSGGDGELHFATKTATDAEPDDYQFIPSSGTQEISYMMRITGQAGSSPITNLAANSEDSTTTTWLTSAITPDEDNSLLIAVAGADEATGDTPPNWTHDSGAGWSEQADIHESQSGDTQGIAYKLLATPASTTHTWTKPTTDVGGMVIFAVAPDTDQHIRPDADIVTTGWTSTPLWSKIEEEVADATIITATAS